MTVDKILDNCHPTRIADGQLSRWHLPFQAKYQGKRQVLEMKRYYDKSG